MGRVIPPEVLSGDENRAVAAILDATNEREGRRRTFVFTDHDARMLLATIRKYPASHIRVYAERGHFVPLTTKYPVETTTVEYVPSFNGAVMGAWVSIDDARRPKGRGPYVTVNGEREV